MPASRGRAGCKFEAQPQPFPAASAVPIHAQPPRRSHPAARLCATRHMQTAQHGRLAPTRTAMSLDSCRSRGKSLLHRHMSARESAERHRTRAQRAATRHPRVALLDLHACVVIVGERAMCGLSGKMSFENTDLGTLNFFAGSGNSKIGNCGAGPRGRAAAGGARGRDSRPAPRARRPRARRGRRDESRLESSHVTRERRPGADRTSGRRQRAHAARDRDRARGARARHTRGRPDGKTNGETLEPTCRQAPPRG